MARQIVNLETRKKQKQRLAALQKERKRMAKERRKVRRPAVSVERRPGPLMGLNRQDLIDALITMGIDPRTAERMSTNDLRTRYDRTLQRQTADA